MLCLLLQMTGNALLILQAEKSASAVAKSLLKKHTIFKLIYITIYIYYSEIYKSLSLPFQRLNFSCVQLSHMLTHCNVFN